MNAALAKVAILMVASLILSGCGGSARPGIRTELVPFSTPELAMRDQAKAARYRIRTGDLLNINFKYEDDLDQSNVLVLPDGFITLSGMRPLPAAGMTVDQVDSLLYAEFSKDYVDPDLSVIVAQLADQKIYVLGEVAHPGMYSIPQGGQGVVQAIALAGGFQDHAKKNQVLVARVTDEGFLYRLCDLSHLDRFGNQRLEYNDLKPFDVVYVPRTKIGDLVSFSDSVLANVLRVSSLFWDVYAITHMSQVDRIIR